MTSSTPIDLSSPRSHCETHRRWPSLIEFRSVVDAVRCAVEVQMAWWSATPACRRKSVSSFASGFIWATWSRRADGDLMGDGVNVAARLEGICEPGEICLSEDAYRQVRSRLELQAADLGPRASKTSPSRCAPISLRQGPPAAQKCPDQRRRRAASGRAGQRLRPHSRSRSLRRGLLPGARATRRVSWPLPLTTRSPTRRAFPSSCCRSIIFPATRSRTFRRRNHRRSHDRPLASARQLRHLAWHRLHLQGQGHRREADRQGPRRALSARRQRAPRRRDHHD